jgi:hypothetical protein
VIGSTLVTPCAARHWYAALAVCLLATVPQRAHAQAASDAPPVDAEAPKPWYERFSIRGYGQIRFNRLLETNPQFTCEQCDRSIGELGGIFIRRARIIFQGQIHERVFMYLQPDFASTIGGSGNVAQLRDWYVDVGLDQANEYRLRIGQSKVPFSYENLQSSQNRLPLDRADATNSSASNERDLGVFFYWAPTTARARLRSLVADGLKGSGDYGVFALGAFNGQTANRPDGNNSQHVVARLSYPFVVGQQIIEPGVAAYRGYYVVTADQRSSGVKGTADWNYRDERILASLNVAPRPFGLLTEYNIGRGPEFNPVTDSIETRGLQGGFVTASYKIDRDEAVYIPFLRYQVYEGGKKHERDARSHRVNDLEFGVEWQPVPAFELVVAYYIGDRRYEDFQRQDNAQRGRFLRLQAQFNY